MMDYYEELGVDRSASPDEIRLAFRRLVRLLHPDRCTEARLRPLAELQMKRLNEVLRILTNPEERARYDYGCTSRSAPLGILSARPRRQWQRYWPVPGAVVFLAAILLLVRPPQPTSGPSPTAGEPTVEQAPMGNSIRTSRPSGVTSRPATPPARKAEAEHGDPPGQVLPLETTTVPYPEVWNADEPPGRPEEISRVAVSAHEVPHPGPHVGFAGEWLFVASSHSKISGLYPPEYVELRVVETSGLLRGRYRARYHVPDRAISPTVDFQFEGRSGEDRANLPWIGTGGAKGEVTLRLVAAGTIEVTWVAHELGEEMGLVSGTATLTRKLE